MAAELTTVPLLSGNSETGIDLIDSAALAARWNVPESWIRNHTRARTPQKDRLPCVRLGRYVRFEWESPSLVRWWEKRRK